MRMFEKMTFGLSAVALAALSGAPAMAGVPGAGPDLPAPGVLGLVAGGVIAAIAVARLRNKK